RDTRIEASRLRRLSPLQTVEDQSRIWGIRCHSCTWRKGLTPLWKTELQGETSPRGLPGSLGFLSTNGSHLHEGRIDVPPQGRQPLSDGLQGTKSHAVLHVHQTPAPHGLDYLGIEQLWQRHPAGLGGWTFVLTAWRLHPPPMVCQQGCQVLPKAIGQKQRGTV